MGWFSRLFGRGPSLSRSWVSKMDLNPLTKKCADIQRQIDQLRQREKELTDELQWYSRVDPKALTDDLQRNEATAEQLRREIQALECEIQDINARLDQLAPAIGTLFNPFNWFAKDQIDLRRRRRQLRKLRKQKDAHRRLKVKELEATDARIVQISTELQRYRTFDFVGRQRDLSQVQQSILFKTEKLALVAERKRRVDQILAPLVDEIQALEKRKLTAEADLEVAEDLDWRLSNAQNSYERAMIHQECERRFDEGSPRKVIAERRKEIRQLERDYNKAVQRLHDVTRKAARQIDTIVIDGNNLCYEGDTFIGLAALEALLPQLSRICSVVVVFDSTIRRLLDDAMLQKRLSTYAKVHIVASRHMADETVLDLAEASKTTYVLSNDRFADFNEKSAVKDGRIIRHEIVNGYIFVHDLQLRAAYR